MRSVVVVLWGLFCLIHCQASSLDRVLDKIVLPELSLEGVSVKVGFQQLEARLKEAGFNVGLTASTLHSSELLERKVFFWGKHLSARKILDHLCERVALSWEVRGGVVMLVEDRSGGAELFTQQFPLPPGDIPSLMKKEPSDWLALHALSCPLGSVAHCLQDKGLLVVDTSAEGLEQIQAVLLAKGATKSSSSRYRTDGATFILAEEEAKLLLQAREPNHPLVKLQKYIIPHYKVENASVKEAVKRIQDALPEVKITLAAEAGVLDSAISLDLREVPADEALLYVCELVSCRILEQQHELIIQPITELGPEEITRIYEAPLSQMEQLAAQAKADGVLTDGSVLKVTKVQKLILKAYPQQHLLFIEWLRLLWQRSGEKPPYQER